MHNVKSLSDLYLETLQSSRTIPSDAEEYAEKCKEFLTLASELKNILVSSEFNAYITGMKAHTPDQFEEFSSQYPLSWDGLVESIKGI